MSRDPALRRCRARLPERGLYAITDSPRDARSGVAERVAAAIRGGAGLVQYRDKSAENDRRHADARSLVSACHALGVPLIVNDDVELALATAADGVHLGKDDVSLESARAALGPAAIIGISCYAEPERALAAQAAGADYVAFGSFFRSETKPDAARVALEVVASVRAELHIPIVAIGGITPENGAALLRAGVNILAVVNGLFGQPDVAAAARAYTALFAES